MLPGAEPALLSQAKVPASFDLLIAFKLEARSMPRGARPETDRLLPNSLSDALPEFLLVFCQIGRQVSCGVFCQICCQVLDQRASIVVDRFLQDIQQILLAGIFSQCATRIAARSFCCQISYGFSPTFAARRSASSLLTQELLVMSLCFPVPS